MYIQVGIKDGQYIIIDDHMKDVRPTPECIADLMRRVVDSFLSMTDGLTDAPAPAPGDEHDVTR